MPKQDAAPAQIRIPQSSTPIAEPAELDALVEQGRVLERQGRWLDALAHYEDLFHKYPDAEKLQLRRTLAQIHVDLDRRLADTTYLQMISTMSQVQASEAFNEVLLKIQSHYVTEPDWQNLTWRGTANLDVALTKQAIRNRYIPQITNEQINAFRLRLRDDVNRRRVSSRSDAADLVVYTARLAQQELGLNPTTLIGEYCCGAISSLDRYSTYLSGGQLDDVYNQIEGNFVGLGIELKAEDASLLIVKVIPAGPANKAGIVAGDRITAVDHVSTESVTTERAAEMLKGEQGSSVVVTLVDQAGAVRTVDVRRERVEVPCVEQVEIIDREGGVGYFRLTSFQKTTSRDVDAALWQLQRQGMRSLIIDLRGNPGGLLTASVEVSDKFLLDGTIVSTRGRSTREDFDYKAHRAGTWHVPLVILIDHDTASASEILAAAIRDHGRGTVIGERSYGKGSVQGIFPLSTARAGVRLTTAKFYAPSGRAISDQGVLPHRHVTAQPLDSPLVPNQPDLHDPVVANGLATAKQLSVANRSR
jgi:carboxyl-terminal processing protease